jgi:hypothetical protein
VGGDGNIPKYPAAYMKMDLGIVPGAQQSTGIANWLQDEIIAMLSRSHEEANINAKVIGVSYHRKLFRGKYMYMVHAKNAVLQELVASTLRDYKIPMAPWVVYNAVNEIGDMESGLKAFKEVMAKITGAVLSSGDRRSLGRRYWNAHKDILKCIAGDETMAAHRPTDWAAAPREQKKRTTGQSHGGKNQVRPRASGSGEGLACCGGLGGQYGDAEVE